MAHRYETMTGQQIQEEKCREEAEIVQASFNAILPHMEEVYQFVLSKLEAHHLAANVEGRFVAYELLDATPAGKNDRLRFSVALRMCSWLEMRHKPGGLKFDYTDGSIRGCPFFQTIIDR